MNSANIEINNWYQNLKSQALDRNEQSAVTWSKYKNDLETTKSLLTMIPKKMKHNVMVPVGPKALMPGAIIHTNEFLVNLGETWFAKKTAHQTIEVCDRRIKSCNEMLEKLEKERKLIINKSTLPTEQDAFGNEERPEIIEYVTEEENEDWKKQHRVREKEYRQKLVELRNKEKKSIQTEEDLWKHLDELELQEELEDELNRLNADCSSEDEPEMTEEISESVNSPKQENQNFDSKKESSESENITVTNMKAKRRVSFVCDLESSDDEPLRLEIKHSHQTPIPSDPISHEINSPSDIYTQHLKLANKVPLSVLKSKTNPNRNYDLELIHDYESEVEEEEEPTFLSSILLNEEDVSIKSISTGVQLNNVSERSVTDHAQKVLDNKNKKISKFKVSRQKSG